MRLLLHQALSDLRHLRPLLLAWVAVLAARTLLIVYPFDVLTEDALEGPWRSLDEFPHLALWVASVGLAVVVGVRLVQSDSPTRTTAFWITRPIGGRTMLVAKFAIAVLFLALLPTAVDVGELAVNGLRADVLQAAAWQGLLEYLALIGPVLALASISADAGGFAMTGLAVFAGGMASLVVVGSILDRGRVPGPDHQWSPLAELGIIAASGVVVACVQYVARSRRLSIALVGAAVVLWATAFFSGPTPIAAETLKDGDARRAMRVRPVPGSTAVVDGIRVSVLRSHCSDGACEVVVREARAELFNRWQRWHGAASLPVYELVTPAGVGWHQAAWTGAVTASPLLPGSHLLSVSRRLHFEPVAPSADSPALADSWLVPVERKTAGPTTPETGSLRGVPR